MNKNRVWISTYSRFESNRKYERIIKNKIKYNNFNNFDSLKEFVKNEWETISNQAIKKAVDGVIDRLKEL